MITQGCLHLAAFLVSRLNTEKSQMKLSNHFLSMEKGDRKVLLLHLEEVDGVVFSMSSKFSFSLSKGRYPILDRRIHAGMAVFNN